MSHDNHVLSIQLMNKTWQIRCPEDKTQDLQKCARLLDNKMHEITGRGSISDDRMLVMAAMNVIYDLLMQQSQKDLYIESLSSRIRELQNKPTKPLPKNIELEV